MNMDLIRENLRKMANDRKQRSKHYQSSFNQGSDLEKGSCSSSIQTSSDSDGIKDTKMMTTNSLAENKSQPAKSAEPAAIQKTMEAPIAKPKMNKMRSESALNIDPAIKQPKRTPSLKAERPRERVMKPKSATTSRERTNSACSTGSRTSGNQIRVKDKTYQVLNVFGKGGSSVVYQVFSEHHRCCLAIKVVNLSNADYSVRKAYENEIQLLAKLQGSPYVIRMYDYEIRKHQLYVIMECGDIDLGTFMHKKAHQIDDKFIKYHWQEMLKCVQVIHDNSIVHSDLKPANFLFVGASLKLIDFGIASNIPSNKTSIVKDIQVGTLNYISPEAITGSYTDSNGRQVYKIPLKSDVWSLGCILYAMVYGRTPFHHITNQTAKINAISSEQHAIEYPKNGKVRDRMLVDVLKKCLVRDVKKRASIGELLRHPYLQDNSMATPSPARTKLPQLPASEDPQPARNEKENSAPSSKANGGLRVIK